MLATSIRRPTLKSVKMCKRHWLAVVRSLQSDKLLADQLYNFGNSLDFSHLNDQQNLDERSTDIERQAVDCTY
jgi:hypothetical protein